MRTNFQKWQFGAAAVLAACLPIGSQAEPFFTNKEGNLVWDKATNLVWQRCSVGQTWDGATCNGSAKNFDSAAVGSLAGNSWRLPTVRELASLVYCSSGQMKDNADPKDGGAAIPHSCAGTYSEPTINTVAFPATLAGRERWDSWYWSSSPLVSLGRTWIVSFRHGDLDSSNRSEAVQAVRLVRANPVSSSKNALAFPVSLAGNLHQVQAQEHSRAVQEKQQKEASQARGIQKEEDACRDKYVGQRVYVGKAAFNTDVYGEVLGVGRTRMTVRILHPSGSREVKEYACSGY